MGPLRPFGSFYTEQVQTSSHNTKKDEDILRIFFQHTVLNIYMHFIKKEYNEYFYTYRMMSNGG